MAGARRLVTSPARSPASRSPLRSARHGLAQADFYKGKTVNFAVRLGGSAAATTSMLARWRVTLATNSWQAQCRRSMNVDAARAACVPPTTSTPSLPKDGTVIACTNPILLMYQLMGGQQARYETAKLQWIGSLDEPNNAIIAPSTSGLRTIEDARAAARSWCLVTAPPRR